MALFPPVSRCQFPFSFFFTQHEMRVNRLCHLYLQDLLRMRRSRNRLTLLIIHLFQYLCKEVRMRTEHFNFIADDHLVALLDNGISGFRVVGSDHTGESIVPRVGARLIVLVMVGRLMIIKSLL